MRTMKKILWLLSCVFAVSPATAAQVHSILKLTSSPQNLMIRHDQHDGIYMVWVTTDATGSSLWLQQANFRGRVRWRDAGRVIRKTAATIEMPQIAANEEGVSLLWRETQGGESELWWQHFDARGHGLQQHIRSGPMLGKMALVSEKTFDRLYWQERGADHCDLAYATVHYPRAGAFVSPVKVMTSQPQCDMDPVAISDREEGVILAWHSQVNDTCQLLAQYVNAEDRAMWEAPGIALTSRCRQPEITALTLTPSHQIEVVWKNHSGMGDEWRAQNIDIGGQRLWSEDGMYLADDANDQAHASVSLDGLGGIFMAWEGAHAESPKIYAQQWDPKGRPLWGEGGQPVVLERPGVQLKPVAVAREQGGYVFWRDSYSPPWSLYAQRMEGEGHRKWPGGIRLSALDIENDPLVAVSTSHGSILLIWLDTSPEEQRWEVKTLLVSAESHSIW